MSSLMTFSKAATSATDLSSRTHACGAILISDRYLLTAAHCMVIGTVVIGERLISINLGKEDLDEDPIPGPNTYGIQDVHIHPAYHKAKNNYNDIAILKTDRKVEYTKNIWPLCLPNSNQKFSDFLPGQEFEISGWGQVNRTNLSPIIQTATVYLVENSQCEHEWTHYYRQRSADWRRFVFPQGLTDQLLCAGRPGVDACQGDSGGPLSYKNINDVRTVVGVIAKGLRCPDKPIIPGFYTNVAHYIDWIYETTGLRPPLEPRNTSESTLPPHAIGKLIRHCNNSCGIAFLPVCGTNNQSYPNQCWLNLISCQSPEENIELKHPGECKECPHGFFMSKGSNQCFKFFDDEHRNWTDANSKCKNEGLNLAKPTDAVAVELTNDILKSYGDD
ncbi:unnamed protein product, partial [Meganyctiphanes norvegica]